MRKFKFRFESVEKVRKSREDNALRVLAEAQNKLRLAKLHKQELIEALNKSLARRERLGTEATDVQAFWLENEFIVGTKQRIIQADQAILRARRGVEKAMQAYLHARRQTRMIEILREKELIAFKREVAKREQRITDDLNVMRARFSQHTEDAA